MVDLAIGAGIVIVWIIAILFIRWVYLSMKNRDGK